VEQRAPAEGFGKMFSLQDHDGNLPWKYRWIPIPFL
jgi:hypothetical protein